MVRLGSVLGRITARLASQVHVVPRAGADLVEEWEHAQGIAAAHRWPLLLHHLREVAFAAAADKVTHGYPGPVRLPTDSIAACKRAALEEARLSRFGTAAPRFSQVWWGQIGDVAVQHGIPWSRDEWPERRPK